MASAAATSGGPSGWIAHSSYGVQLSAPANWSVQVFGQCPDGRHPGTLFIGTTRFVDDCPEIGSATTQVDLYRSGGTPPVHGVPRRHAGVHGLTVLESPTGPSFIWTVPSRGVTITGSGPEALRILKTLAPAGRHAVAASGVVDGTEYARGVGRVPVSGPISVTRSTTGTVRSIDVVESRFWFPAAPGRYVLVGHGGDGTCEPVAVVAVSGETVDAPPVQCQGD